MAAFSDDESPLRGSKHLQDAGARSSLHQRETGQHPATNIQQIDVDAFLRTTNHARVSINRELPRSRHSRQRKRRLQVDTKKRMNRPHQKISLALGYFPQKTSK